MVLFKKRCTYIKVKSYTRRYAHTHTHTHTHARTHTFTHNLKLVKHVYTYTRKHSFLVKKLLVFSVFNLQTSLKGNKTLHMKGYSVKNYWHTDVQKLKLAFF